tara:strand:- start:623 stop:784 length:162 start_codon:yes stop_codon:yes gene_type:complete
MLIVKSNIKNISKNYNISGDFAEELNKQVEELVRKACQRAEANSRKTVMAKDL